ncbi:helix-turn-helix domain-containing protein [Brevibacillus borstelensis]|uniref:helix-turn-helix domain-containing protein n=1 Tax=Brevibacillus borstelensis TaxID=45462 RepID=UPI0030BC32FE
MNFKMTLRAARVNRGLTIKDVAKRTGKCVDTISKYESDSTSIPQDLMIELLGIYRVPFEFIFFGKESEFHGFLDRKKITA